MSDLFGVSVFIYVRTNCDPIAFQPLSWNTRSSPDHAFSAIIVRYLIYFGFTVALVATGLWIYLDL